MSKSRLKRCCRATRPVLQPCWPVNLSKPHAQQGLEPKAVSGCHKFRVPEKTSSAGPVMYTCPSLSRHSICSGPPGRSTRVLRSVRPSSTPATTTAHAPAVMQSATSVHGHSNMVAGSGANQHCWAHKLLSDVQHLESNSALTEADAVPKRKVI